MGTAVVITGRPAAMASSTTRPNISSTATDGSTRKSASAMRRGRSSSGYSPWKRTRSASASACVSVLSLGPSGPAPTMSSRRSGTRSSARSSTSSPLYLASRPMKSARGGASMGRRGMSAQRLSSMPKGITSVLFSNPSSSRDSARCARLGTTMAAARRSTARATKLAPGFRVSWCCVTTRGVRRERSMPARSASGWG